jgi:hypothetical protein
MRHHIPVITICIVSAGFATGLSAQSPAPERLLARAALETGHVSGLVSDAVGRGVADASVLALGQTLVSARSDARGHFQLALPPGDYVLRATRSGYISTYREPVRVRSSVVLLRNITMTRQGEAISELVADESHAHTDLAWWLRHLSRSVLRDGMTEPGSAASSPPDISPSRAADSASRWAAALADADFRGQLNFMTTAVAGPISDLSEAAWPRGVAFMALGSPVVGYGAWQLRAAVASGDRSSWNVLGEYVSNPTREHVWNLRLSYSAQGYTIATEQLSAATGIARSAAGVSGQDRWRIGPALEVEYGLRAERFDYLSDPQLFSGHAGVRMVVLPRTFVRVQSGQNMIAPGADEFLPPAGGPWLPAERYFVPLSGRGTLSAETVRYADLSVSHHLGESDAWPTLRFRGFRQHALNQMTTLFGVADQVDRGQYFVAPVGAVSLQGWSAGATGHLGRFMRGQVEYSHVSSTWDTGNRLRAVRRVAPSVIREDFERVHDLTATVEAELARTATHVNVIYRASTGFSGTDGAAMPAVGHRFDLQVRQVLPYQPTRSGRLELVFAIRNLFRDARGEASWYDELLTVGPPLRLMGGIQVRF